MEEVCWVFEFILNNLLVALQWQMKHSDYLIEVSDFDYQTDDEKEAINGV